MSKYTKIAFNVVGTAEPHPRPRARIMPVKSGRSCAQIYTPAGGKARAWQQAVARAARRAYAGPAMVGPVSATIVVYAPRPKKYCRKRDDPGPLPMDARGSGDADNYAKGILDAIEGICFVNDAQVTRLSVEKWYTAVGAKPHARVVLWGFPGEDNGGTR